MRIQFSCTFVFVAKNDSLTKRKVKCLPEPKIMMKTEKNEKKINQKIKTKKKIFFSIKKTV